MDSVGVWLLGAIALGSLVQGAFLIGLAVGGVRLARRVGQIQKDVDGRIRPALDNLSRVSQNLREVSAVASEQARRVDAAVRDARDRLDDARDKLRRTTSRPLDSLRDVTAVVKGVRRGIDVYRRLGSLEAQRHRPVRRYAEDEHLFI